MFKLLNKNIVGVNFLKKDIIFGEKSQITFSPILSTLRNFTDPNKNTRGKTPIGKLDKDIKSEEKEDEAPDPYAPFPENKNPVTGEIAGPRGPEPTRYGDWERKGRVSDF